ncbi:hypothetical protein TorRG33x02_079320 [Trema orientale]|uniref:Uncharacterized protein n=1 Tax=Trema orientale TaxID=63057 RepID=A0A2P5FEX2_TREOI|nr:hypothetical protein TorRG33x02_079320 [Trema orientale]
MTIKELEQFFKKAQDANQVKQSAINEKIVQLTALISQLSAKFDHATNTMESKNAKLSKEIVKISITQQRQHIDEITHASIVAKSYDSSSSQPESQPTPAELSPPPATQSPQRAARVTIPNIVDDEFILEDITEAAHTHFVGQPICNQARYDLSPKLGVEAPEFDGHLDPNAFLDSFAAIEDYFDKQHIRFAKMKLTCSARRY